MKTRHISLCAIAFAIASATLVRAEPITLETAPPVVVKTVPEAGATDVDPALAEIRVTFSKPMQNGNWSWGTWGEGNYPKTTGAPRYLEDGRTCVLPVKLEPNKFYATWINSEKFAGFKDIGGRFAVPYLLTFTTAAASPAPFNPRRQADELPGELVFHGRYKHRSRGNDMEVPSELWVKESPDGGLLALAYLPFAGSTELATGDEENRLINHRIEGAPSGERPGYRIELEFANATARLTRRGVRENVDGKELKVPEGALFDPNSRPDSYCAANILLRAFDLREGETKEFRMFDWDNSGEGLVDYSIRVTHAGKERVEAPAGTFQANHLVLTQVTSADTWFKKRAGHVTDFWVLDNDVIVRVLRHREPYEMVLLDYAFPGELQMREGTSAAEVSAAVDHAVGVISRSAEGDQRVAEELRSLAPLDQSQVVAALASHLSSSTPTRRRAAIYILWKGDFKDIAAAVEVLQKLLEHEEDLTRGTAALALGERRVAASFEKIATMAADDPSGYARRCAVYALGLLGDPRAEPVLRNALNDPERLVQQNAQRALDMLGTSASGKAGTRLEQAGKKTRDNVLVEDLALRMLAAIRDKEDDVLNTLSADRIKGWRDAWPNFAFELRERFQQFTGKPFSLQVGESLVEGDYAAVKCTGPKELEGKHLVLFFVKTDEGWRNCLGRNSPPETPLGEHLANVIAEIQKRADAAGTQRGEPVLRNALNDPQRLVQEKAQRAREILEASQSNNAEATFGPVVEAALRFEKKTAAELLDLDTGHRAANSEFGNNNDSESLAWIRENKLDLIGGIQKGEVFVLGFDMVVAPAPNGSFDEITPKEVLANGRLEEGKADTMTGLSSVELKTDTLFFRTREGGRGLLQIMGESKDQPGVKVRYKLVQQLTNVQEEAISSNVRMIQAAAEQYFLEERGATNVETHELIGQDRYMRSLDQVAGETYPAVITRGLEIVAMLPDGSEIRTGKGMADLPIKIKRIVVDKTRFSDVYPAVWFSPATGEIVSLLGKSEQPPEEKYEVWIEPGDPEFRIGNGETNPEGKTVGFAFVGYGEEVFTRADAGALAKLEPNLTDLMKGAQANDQPVFYCRANNSTCLIMITEMDREKEVISFAWRPLSKEQQ